MPDCVSVHHTSFQLPTSIVVAFVFLRKQNACANFVFSFCRCRVDNKTCWDLIVVTIQILAVYEWNKKHHHHHVPSCYIQLKSPPGRNQLISFLSFDNLPNQLTPLCVRMFTRRPFTSKWQTMTTSKTSAVGLGWYRCIYASSCFFLRNSFLYTLRNFDYRRRCRFFSREEERSKYSSFKFTATWALFLSDIFVSLSLSLAAGQRVRHIYILTREHVICLSCIHRSSDFQKQLSTLLFS